MGQVKVWIVGMFLALSWINSVFANCQQLASKLLNPPPASSVVTKLDAGTSADLGGLEQLLISRSKLGEVTPTEVSGLMAAVAKLDALLGHSVLGGDVPGCLQNFSPPAIKAFVDLFSQVAAVKNEGELLGHLKGRAKQLFGDTDDLAHQRICAFTGVSPALKCQILNTRYASSCH